MNLTTFMFYILCGIWIVQCHGTFTIYCVSC